MRKYDKNGELRLNENQDETLLLVTHPDEICKKCPNLVDGRYCVDITNHVQKKDEKSLEPLKLNGNKTYTYRQLKEHAQKYLTKEVFEKSCSNCEWYDKGLCRYEDFDWK